jgi:VIT1/CCC1 family predicted Fe2+/Mn2+ transporter
VSSDPNPPDRAAPELLAISLRRRLVAPDSHRQWAIDANDGVIATAGLLQGFAGAGAGDRLLLFTATAATIAGGLSTGGAKWAEESAERDAQQLVARHEQQDLSADPDGEIEELSAHWQHKGLTPEVAREVAEQLSARDALGAQLEWEYGFDEPMSWREPVWAGMTSTIAYTLGALIPLLITYFAPVAIETTAILAAVLVAVGAMTLAVSYVAGSLLIDG